MRSILFLLLVVGLPIFEATAEENVLAQPRMHSEVSTQHTPQLCTGELPYADEVKYGMIFAKPPDTTAAHCPPDYAIYATLLHGRPITENPASVAIRGICCPLPAKDILIDEFTEVVDSCPKDYVAVGTTFECESCVPRLRCQKINSSRYYLSEVSSGEHWGATSTPWKYRTNLLKSDIPRGIRAGVSRAARYDYYSSGCVGYPFGSLLVAKTGKRCPAFKYRRLLFRGLSGDPVAGTPVAMYRNCQNLSESPEGELRCND